MKETDEPILHLNDMIADAKSKGQDPKALEKIKQELLESDLWMRRRPTKEEIAKAMKAIEYRRAQTKAKKAKKKAKAKQRRK